MEFQTFIICLMFEVQVCVTERVNIHPLVLEKFIQCCDGDIRKAIMHLQFWFQSKRVSKGESPRTCLLNVCMLYISYYEYHNSYGFG